MTCVLLFEVRVDGKFLRNVESRAENISIGRGGGVHVRTSDPYLKELHAVVNQRQDGSAVLLHYGGRSPTLLNGTPVRSEAIREGDVIRCGNTELRLLSRQPRAGSGARGAEGPLRQLRNGTVAAVRRRLSRL